MPETFTREYLDDQVLTHFNLPSDPFDDTFDPEKIWMSPAHVALEGRFVRTALRHEMIGVVAATGAGKSTLTRRFIARMAGNNKVRLITPASLDRKRITATAISVAILRDLRGKDTSSLSMEARSELMRGALMEQSDQGVHPVLMIDEAHDLTPPALLAIKRVWDSHLQFRQLAVVLVGQEPLMERVKQDPALKEVSGRMTFLEVPKLTAIGKYVARSGPGTNWTAEYVKWRFLQVGADVSKSFTPDALAAVGVRGEHPLWVNALAVRAMMYTASVGDPVVTVAHVGKV